QAAVSDVADDSDDFAPGRIFVLVSTNSGFDTFSDRVLVRKNLLRERLGDDDYGRGAMLVAIIEVAALNDRNTHCLEVTDSGREEVSRRLVLGRQRSSFDLKRNDEAIVTQRQRQDRAR